MNLRRLTLTRRDDDRVYLDRWGFETRFGGVYLHKINAPDPGLDMHDHPWTFVSIILSGGYVERYNYARALPYRPTFRRAWGAGTAHLFRLDMLHQIVAVLPNTWTLILRGPRRRAWGFYTPNGWIEANTEEARARRDVNDSDDRKAA